MPVKFDEYDEDTPRVELAPGTNAREIMTVLLENPGIGFTAGELHERTDIPRGSINPTLGRLHDAGLVRHKGDYWAVTTDDRLAAANAAVLGVRSATDTYAEDWYGENEGWSDDLPDLQEDDTEE